MVLCAVLLAVCADRDNKRRARAMGDTLIPTIITATGICVFRVAWIYTVVPLHNSMFTVSLSYPISWVLTAIAFAIYYMIARKKLIANAPKPRTAE